MSGDENKIEATPELLQKYGEVFAQLLESQRFKEFFEFYFTLHKYVDDVNKTVTFTIIENPPEIIAQKMRDKAMKDKPIIEVIPEAAVTSFNKKLKKHR